jgi:putative cardiolipin synthase
MYRPPIITLLLAAVAILIIAGCATLPKDFDRPESYALTDTGNTVFGKAHAKSFIFDRKQVFIGSLNLDPRAVKHNTEIGVVLTVPAIAEEMAARFEENIEQLAFRLELKKDENGYEQLLWHGWEKGQPTVYTHEPHTGFWRRLGIDFMSIWPIESQL